MAVEQSSEARELSLVGKVEMRIALADSDAKLSTILGTYLAPLLLKLASEHQPVRNKVISVCQHINTRVQPATVILPVQALVKQFKEQTRSLIRHFDLLYIQQGVSRLSARERGELLPVLCKGIAGSGSHGSQIFGLMLRLLEAFALPPRGSKDDVELRQKMEIADSDAQFLSEWIGKLILFTLQKATSGSTTSPGLTADDYAFLTIQGKPDVWNPSNGGLNLLRTKILAAKVLASGLFTDTERFLPALFAAADPASTLSDVGDDMLKRALPATDLEDDHLIKHLYDLYFGSAGRPRVRAPLRLKVLGLFNKSTQSTTFANNIMKLVDDGISPPVMDGEDTVMSNGPVTGANIGREATKLRSAIFTYINFVAKYGPQETLHAIASRVVNRLRDFIENQGWPKPGANEDLVSRGYAYEVIGLLAKAGPRSILLEDENPTLDLLRWLLTSLAKDSSGSSIVVSIEESLSTVLSAMSRMKVTAPEQKVLEDLLIDQMEQSADLEGNKRLRSTRYVSVRFANRCLPYSSVKGRWIDVLGLGAMKDRAEVRDEAERGLSPYWYRMLNGSTGAPIADEVAFPTFGSVMEQFFAGRTTSRKVEPAALAQEIARTHPECFREIVAYARRTLFQEALRKEQIPPEIDSEWERRLDTAVESDVKARDVVRRYLRRVTDDESHKLETLECALYEGVIGKAQITDDHLVDFLALAPDELIAKLASRTDALMPVLQSNNHDRRVAAAKAFGILASHPSAASQRTGDHVAKLQETAQLWDGAVGAAANQCHGAVVALGYFFSRAAFRGHDIAGEESYQQLVQMTIDILAKSRDSLLKEASFTALGQLAMFNAVDVAAIEKTSQIREVIDKIYDTAKGGNEAAILCLGQVSMILPEQKTDDSDLAYVQDRLHKLHEIRQAEVHFTVGEALSCLAAGWRSGALATKLDIDGAPPAGSTRTATLEKLTDRVLADCANTKPALKKAAVMWLLCLVQFCGAEPSIRSRLPKCQAAFKRCLSDRDELVQETASRGLGLLYEKGDRGLKDDLVRDLVSSFSSDRQSQLAGNVSEDTQLFEPGALPTGEGQSVSTYKDIMSLASEVGDQSLVYRFMSMASSNAIWSSRAAFGRFGLSNVLSDSSVDGYLAENPKLYPKLFRYRFDPNGGVQRSMNDIWNALVKDSTATVDKHFDAIMEDLLTSILGKEWRVRQASCAAIADLVSGRPLEKYERYLERIWTQCFKVMDDIKESVRAAAASLARTLTGVLTRALEADHSSTKNASTMLTHVLPFLLSTSGVESSAKETQAFSIHTLLEIIKKSNGSTLRPHIPELVERFIGLLSSVEPEAVNYIHMNASKYNLTEQKIDDMRLSSVRNSPLMEAIERCIDLLDEESMRQLQPRLESAMKSAVGLPSKVGSSRVLVSLSTRRMPLYRPYSGDALKLVEKLILDRNETVSSSYAVAAGYIARGATDKQLLRLFTFAKKLYFESEGDRESIVPRRSLTSGEIMAATAKYASDRFNALASAALPFVFVAKHDPNEQVKEQFQNTWNEAVGGSRAVSLYLGEILEICQTHLDSQQWALKHTSARAVADAVTAVSSLEAKMSDKAGEQLWPALEKALGGKTWEGKEVVVYAFAKFVEVAQAFYTPRREVNTAITKIAVREAKRQNVAYRQHSMKALARVAAAREDIDMSGSIYDIVSPLLEASNTDGDKMEVDGDDAAKSEQVAEATRVAAIEALFASVNPSILQASDLQHALTRSLDVVASMPDRSLGVRRALYPGMGKMFGRIQEKGIEVPRFDVSSLRALLFSTDAEVEAVRLLRADAVVAAAKALPWLVQEVRSELEKWKAGETSKPVLDRLADAA